MTLNSISWQRNRWNSMDAQQVEIVGLNALITSLVRNGIETAAPLRDRGVDLIAYSDSASTFDAIPIQLKAFSTSGLSIDRKYSPFPQLLMVFVWDCDQLQQRIFAMGYEQLLAIATELGWTQTRSWTENGKYSTSSPSKQCQYLLAPHQTEPGHWEALIHDRWNSAA